MNESALYPGWETVREIGSGSFGTVYEIARTLPNGKTEKAALKVISIPQNEGDVEELYSSGYDDASITAHFKSYLADIVNEYSLMAEIKGHTNVVYCDDIRYIQHDDGFGWDIFIKMELLTPLMKAKASGAVEDTVKKLGADICSALVLCREKNIIHRDIKPQNIFVSEHEDYKLGDFGIAKTVEKTTGGTKIGTYGYMAPEVYNNQPYGAAADIYSLGLVMYWLLNEHRLPFLPMPPKVPTSTENEQARLRRFRGEPIPAPKNGSEALKRIVLKACAYDPSDRYHTADEMLEDLKGLENRQTTDVNSIEEKASMVETNNSCRKDDVVAGCEDMASDETMATVGAFCQTESGMAGPSGEHAEKMQPRKKPNKSKRKKSHGAWVITVAVILIGTVCGIYGYLHCWFGHVWGATTCTEPATCMRCGSVRGKALGHTWQAATCTKPATCMRCGAVSGKALGHNWPTMEELSYCLRCNYPNGKLKQLDVGDWHSEWTNETVKFGLGNGKTVDCTPFKPRTKIEKCYSLILHLEIKQYSYGNIEGEWGFYIHDLNGEWHLADSFILSGNQAEVYFEFDEPISFDLWACPCHCLGSDWSFSYAAWLRNIRVFELAE